MYSYIYLYIIPIYSYLYNNKYIYFIQVIRDNMKDFLFLFSQDFEPCHRGWGGHGKLSYCNILGVTVQNTY
jgi:hypothetical protein